MKYGQTNYRNGWVIRLDDESEEERKWWSGGPAFSTSLHDAVFFATERDAVKVHKQIIQHTVVEYLHDPREPEPQAAKHEGDYKRAEYEL